MIFFCTFVSHLCILDCLKIASPDASCCKRGLVGQTTGRSRVGSWLSSTSWSVDIITQFQNTNKYLRGLCLVWFIFHRFQDNEFELVFVLGYQKMLALAYLDKVHDLG